MDTQRETRDFMNVESFSQLPFIRPAPVVPAVKEKGSSTTTNAGGAIRLFGKEFGGQKYTNDHNIDHLEKNKSSTSEEEEEDRNKDSTGSDNQNSEIITSTTRKFECHYCCRNFPTSQALGGHQNAHKRERQHAKRAHLQSAMASDAHVYGLMSHYRSSAAAPPSLSMSSAYYSTTHSNSWNSTTTTTTNATPNYNNNNATSRRLYGTGGYHGSYNYNNSQPHHDHQQPPINGSPLALWRIPTSANHMMMSNSTTHVFGQSSMRHQQIPLFINSKDNHHNVMKPFSAISNGPSSRVGYGYEQKPSMQDHERRY